LPGSTLPADKEQLFLNLFACRFTTPFLQALKRSLKPDSKVLSKLEGEVDNLHSERTSVTQHIERTESWAEHLGKWRCHVQNVEHKIVEGEKEATGGALVAALIIHLPQQQSASASTTGLDELGSPGAEEATRNQSWTCVRKVGAILKEFCFICSYSYPYGGIIWSI
jgi:hypothetical protein